MIGLTPDQQAYIGHAAIISLVIIAGLAPAWLRKQYTIRGIFKRIRCHL